jgi:hypothetical protein
VKKIIREYRFELLAVLLAVLGVFLLLEQFQIRITVANAFRWLVNLLETALASLSAYLSKFTLSDMIGWILILGTSVLILWRVRYRFLHSENWRATVCPRCEGELERVHRTAFDRLVEKLFLPRARRYRCSNAKCNWSGLRRQRPNELHEHLLRSAEEGRRDLDPMR